MKSYNLHHKNTSALIGYANNSRTHSDEQVNQVASSIKEFGFTNPILIDEQNGVIAGHGRLMAAKKLGLETVPCIVLEGLTEAQKKAYVIADNKLQENGGWNNELLRIEIQDIGDLGFDVDLLGFSEKELSKIFDETAGITIEDSLQDNDLSSIIVKFLPCDKIEIMNAVNSAISEYKDAYIWVSDDE